MHFSILQASSSLDSDLILSDNYFCMEKGTKTVENLEDTPKNIRLRSLYDIRQGGRKLAKYIRTPSYVGKVPATFENGKMKFTVGDNFPCLYYHIVAE